MPSQPPLTRLLSRISDRLAGGPGAVANAAEAVRQDAFAGRQRRAAWAALTAHATPAGTSPSPDEPRR